IRRWEQLGLTERWQQRDIALFGRNSASGTYAYFKQHVLCQGDFNLRTHQLAGSSAVVQAVSQTPNAIGYAGIGNAAAGVRVVPLYNAERTAVVAPTPENALQGSYPLARVLYLYINKAPAQPLALPEREFLRMVLSSAGQKFIRQEGYQPLPADTVLRIRTELELDTDD
ncbi:substrate-binding domain-containing protein, partial [Chromatiaceae bacterium AAb-1]|nr:substrate-binding domain-containing protein [Chromatiaceae bacterium AAb-1]